jgi:hypothetical protein
MSIINMRILALGAILSLCMASCKNENKADSSLEAWGPDTLTTNAPPKKIAQSDRSPASSSPNAPDRNSNATSSATNGANTTTSTKGADGVAIQSGVVGLGVGPSGKRWWDNRTIFFMDFVGATGDIVYDAVKGQQYFPETRIFIYCTDKSMEGGVNYNKTKMTIEETETDDRIFMWVHLDENRKPLFVRTLISKNIKDKIKSAPLKI